MDLTWLGEKIGEQGTWALVIITAIITLLVSKGGGALLALSKGPLVVFFEFLYSRIAPAIPFVNVRLVRYRRHVLRSDLAFIENPIGPDGLQITLEESFAPLRMLAGEQRGFVELFPYAAERNRLIILGSPGSGKTTLMKNLIISILRGRCHRVLNGKIPVFVVLRHMAAEPRSGHLPRVQLHSVPRARNCHLERAPYR